MCGKGNLKEKEEDNEVKEYENEDVDYVEKSVPLEDEKEEGK
jgi:hypothetical protein